MPDKNLICIVVDRLHAGMVGAYGNSWIRTGAIDHLASESFLFDSALLESPRLDHLYQAYWMAQHAATAGETQGTSFPQVVAAAGYRTALVTDEPVVAELPAAGQFAETLLVATADEPQTAEDVLETELARLFAAAAEWLEAAQAPFCLWIHARGMAGPWDAPLALRNAYADEDDPVPPALVEAPNDRLPEDHDPDEVLGIRHAYAGQVAALDQCVEGLCDQLEASGQAKGTLLTLLSGRGFPLGEHGRIGPCDEPLFNELTQLVWMMRFPDGCGALARSPALVQPSDLPGTLLDGLELDRTRLGAGHASSLLEVIGGKKPALRDRVLLLSGNERAVRTPGWYLRLPADGQAELYAKPSDRWEVSEVASLADDVVAGLQDAVRELETRGSADGLPALPALLVSEPD